jgi:hypothetical protein
MGVSMNELLRKRRALSLKIAEEISVQFGRLAKTDYDVDRAADIIDMMIPLTYAEHEAEIEETQKELEPYKPKRSGLGERLRTALGLGKEISLDQTIEAAIERAEKCKDLEREVERLERLT